MRPAMMSTLLLTLSAIPALSAGVCRANESVTLTLRPAAEVGPQATAVNGPAGEPAIEVLNAGTSGMFTLGTPSTFTLATGENPAITSPDYVLRGRVKCNVVAAPPGSCYLELLSDFGDKGVFFSRFQLAPAPTGQEATGMVFSGDWRNFELPFHAEPGMKPTRLTLNAFLTNGARVAIAGPLVVTPLNSSAGWWTEQQAGTIGGVLGCLGGLLGSLIGVSAGCRKFTLSRIFCGIGLAAGTVSLVAGLVALSVGQPWHVWYPLLLVGFISMTVCGPLLALGFRLSQADELRRMTGLDVV